MRRDGYWISAPPKKGCFIVNVGDQLQAWSNDLYVSTLHRVLNYSGQERYSVPFFFSANYETVIEVSVITFENGERADCVVADQGVDEGRACC
jgi:isopenicillin N synthase-like dioxygenase